MNLSNEGCCRTGHLRRLLFLQEQIEWAVKYKADYMVAETIHYYGEAKIALDAIKKYGKGK